MDEKLFNEAKRGYDKDEVDSYLKELHAVINSYKEKDNAIKNAIINAQISADNIIKNAEIEGERIKGRAVKLLDEIQDSIDVKKSVAHEFQNEYNLLIQRYLHNLDDADFARLFGKISELESYVGSMQKIHGADTEELDSNSIVSKMVVGIQKENTVPPESTADADKSNDDMVAPVIGLLAKDSDKDE